MKYKPEDISTEVPLGEEPELLSLDLLYLLLLLLFLLPELAVEALDLALEFITSAFNSENSPFTMCLIIYLFIKVVGSVG